MQRVQSVGHMAVIRQARGSHGSGSSTPKLWWSKSTAGGHARRHRAQARGSTPRPSPHRL
jgi:hypothetical protein